MREVSCQQLNILFNALDNNGIPRERLVDGSPFTLELLENSRNRIDWDDFADLQAKFTRLIGGGPDELEAVGAGSFDTYRVYNVASIVAHFARAHRFYWAIAKWAGNQNFAGIVATYNELPDKRIMLTMELPASFKGCADYFWICKGVYRMVPTLIGLPEAQVEAEITPRRAVFYITPPPPLTIVARLRRFFKIIGAGKTAIEELRAQQDQLRASYEELRQAHDKLAQSEERFRTLFETAFSGMLIHEGGIILEANQAAADMLGYRPEEAVGKSVLDFLDPASREGVAAKMSSPDDLNYEVVAVKIDGSPINLEVVSKVYSYQGRPVRIAAMRDVTEQRKLAKEALKVRKLESIGVVAGGIAHDFRNLLTVNLANIDLAQRCFADDDPGRARLSKARQAALKAHDLTERLLTFSLGGTPVKNPVSLAELIKESVDFYLAGSNVKCVADIADDLWPAEVDAGQIHQVVQNLIVNASEAMAGGIAKVEAQNIEIDEDGALPLTPGKYVLIKVKDNGSGIPESLLAKVFDPFFTTKDGSAGLGLATAHSIVKRHSGYIFANSKVGKGSTFYVYLPAPPAHAKKKKALNL